LTHANLQLSKEDAQFLLWCLSLFIADFVSSETQNVNLLWFQVNLWLKHTTVRVSLGFTAILLIMWLLLGRGEQQQTIIAPNSNVTVGNKLIDNTVVNNNAYYGISPDVFAKYTADLGVTDAALANFFNILEQNKVDRLDLDKKLREIAENYQKLLENAKLLENSDDPKVKELLRQAREFIEGLDAQGKRVKIDFAQAEALLQQAFEEKRLKIKRLREVEEKAKTAREKEELEAARILAQQGELANTQLKYADAGSYYQQAAELLPAGYEKDKGRYFNNAGTGFYEAGKYEQALPLLKEASEIWGQVLGKEHPHYATSLNNLALLYKSQGKYEEALPLYREALKIKEQVLGKEHPDYVRSLNNLATLYYSQGKYEEALPLFQESLKIREQVLGKQHPDYALSLNNLAGLYKSQGKYEEALPLYQEALKIREQVLGKEHPDYAGSLNNLATLYDSQGKYEEALPLYQEALKIREQVLGKKHPDYAQSLNNLATLYDSQGKYEEALPLYQQAVEIQTKALGEQHSDSQLFAENLRRVQDYLNGKQFQVIVKQVLPDSRAAQLGIQVGDIFTHYNQQPILGMAQFIQGRAKEPADGAAKELTVLRDGKSLTFQLKPGKIGVELEEKLKSEP
jgi:tetratricopeptide (TPR) repeat protein